MLNCALSDLPATPLMDVTIPDFHKARVLVFGDIMLDRYWGGPTSRISPEAPVPVVKIQDTENRAGGAGNVAHRWRAACVQSFRCTIECSLCNAQPLSLS